MDRKQTSQKITSQLHYLKIQLTKCSRNRIQINLDNCQVASDISYHG